jgi:tetrapyrrole methylase family protein / MazG family protein
LGWHLLQNIREVYVRTTQHPAVAGFPNSVRIHSFDHLYQQGDSFESVYAQIIEKILELGRQPEGVVYAVPGHPFVAETTCPEIYRRAKEMGIPVQVIEGISFVSSVFSAVGVDPFPHTALADALELGLSHVPPFPPDAPALIAQIYSTKAASEVKLTLMEVYPDDHLVKLVHAAGTKNMLVEELPLFEIDRSEHIGLLTSLYIPAVGPAASFEAFQEIISHLRAPDGCPWDREQNHQTLRPHLLEETFEVLSAIDADDPEALSEELGDLLLQIVLHAQIASEYGEFKMPDVLRKIHTKIVSRHPHVFGSQDLPDADSVVQNWERIKAVERETNNKAEAGVLGGVSTALPALMLAQTYQTRAARVGFDWPEVEGVLQKIEEEIEEIRSAPGEPERASEIGDLLFALVNLARWYKIDAESALREANQRFRARFSYIERAARAEGRAMTDMTLDEMEVHWQAAKQAGSE